MPIEQEIAGIRFAPVSDAASVTVGFEDRKMRNGLQTFLARLPEVIDSDTDTVCVVWGGVMVSEVSVGFGVKYHETLVITDSEFIVLGKSILEAQKEITVSLRVPLVSITGLERGRLGNLKVFWDGKKETVAFDPSIRSGNQAAIQAVVQQLLDHQAQMVFEDLVQDACHSAQSPTHPIPLSGRQLPPNLYFYAVLVGEAGYGIAHPVLIQVAVSRDATSLYLIDPTNDYAYVIPADRYITSDFEGGEYSRGGNLVGGGFGVVGAALGMASAAAVNRLTRKEGVETVWLLTTEDGELTLFTEAMSPNEITSFIGDFRVASRKARASLSEQATAPSYDLADQLARLAQLHASGVLTDDEFAQAKSRLVEGSGT